MLPTLRELPPTVPSLRSCPHCGGWLYVESWHELYDLLCIMCGRTAAAWRPGMAAWQMGSILEDTDHDEVLRYRIIPGYGPRQ